MTNLMTESSCRERESILEDPAHNVYVGLTDGRGRGLFIRRDAKAGETVLTERCDPASSRVSLSILRCTQSILDRVASG